MFTTSTLLTAVSLSLSASASCINGAHGHSFARRANDDAVPIAPFSYSGEKGPINWASLDPANDACRSGKIQSPIILDNTIPKAKTKPVVKLQNVDDKGIIFQVSRENFRQRWRRLIECVFPQ